MAQPAPVHANVTLLRIPRFGDRTVAEQAAAKERLEGRVRLALAGVPVDERIVLDAPDGVGIADFGLPARALDLAQALRATPGEEALQVGLNHGPIALSARDATGKVFGDGITAAAAAARFASPERVFVTTGFARMLAATAPARSAELAPAGEFTDSRVRMHAFYTPEPARLVARRNRLAAYALSGILAILVLGVIGREASRRYFPPRPAVVEFEVRPRGDIFVDGLSYGKSPPLREVELPPGRHLVEVRNPGYPTLAIQVNLNPAEHMTVTHTFASAPKKPEKKEGFLDGLRRKLPW